MLSWNLLLEKQIPILASYGHMDDILSVHDFKCFTFKRVCILDFACIWFYHTSYQPWSWIEKNRIWTLRIHRLSLHTPLTVHVFIAHRSLLIFMSIALIMQWRRVSLETSSNETFSVFFVSSSFFLSLPFIHRHFVPLQSDEFHIGPNNNIIQTPSKNSNDNTNGKDERRKKKNWIYIK